MALFIRPREWPFSPDPNSCEEQHFFTIGVSHTALSVLSDRSRVWEVNIYGLWRRDKRVLTIQIAFCGGW